MRSTPLYAGLDSNAGGTSMHAFMKKTICVRLPNLHCMCHNPNLSLGDVTKKCEWISDWLLHIKALFNWFSKSPGRKAALRRLHTTMELLGRVVTWRMTLPKYYCPTRWLGLHRALQSILAA